MIERDLGNITGTVARLPAFERRSHLLVLPALSETQEGRTPVQVTNPLDYQIKYRRGYCNSIIQKNDFDTSKQSPTNGQPPS